ncbi:MAG: 4,5-dihydroxyphthalate decarboxylase [Dehalococcoidia bacterium]|nr:4,5-dihydroxyphthalate decarboxylase [Dehalococcoidia bacterium]
MQTLTLSTAVGNYGHTRPLKDGSIVSSSFKLDHKEITPVISIFRRMVRGLEFDVSEMALSTYLCAKAHGKPFTGIPVFLTRSFYHSGLLYNRKSGIKSVSDLCGRRIGVRGYTVTPGVWTRAILETVYGVDLDSVIWVLSGDEHVAEYIPPHNVISSSNSNLMDMLISGEIDVAIGAGKSDSPDIQPLFHDPEQYDRGWFEDTGLYPISHMLVIRDEILQSNPEIAGQLFDLFSKAKDDYLYFLNKGDGLSSQDHEMLNFKDIVGGDPICYGIESSRDTLEAFIEFNVRQGVISEPVSVDSLFAK